MCHYQTFRPNPCREIQTANIYESSGGKLKMVWKVIMETEICEFKTEESADILVKKLKANKNDKMNHTTYYVMEWVI